MGLIEDVRFLAKQGKASYSSHALNRLLSRNISTSTVKSILTDNNNQLIEIQSKSNTLGMEHKDDRLLVYSPNSSEEVIVVTVLVCKPQKELRIITAERVDYSIWDKHDGNNPALTRK